MTHTKDACATVGSDEKMKFHLFQIMKQHGGNLCFATAPGKKNLL